MTREEILMKSAAQLQKTARSIAESNMVGDRLWVSTNEDAILVANDKAEHDEMVVLAAALLVMARPA